MYRVDQQRSGGSWIKGPVFSVLLHAELYRDACGRRAVVVDTLAEALASMPEAAGYDQDEHKAAAERLRRDMEARP